MARRGRDPDGEIVGALDLGTGWSATVKVADPLAEWDKTVASLKAQGFTVLDESRADTGAFGAFENDAIHVQVTALPEGQQDGPAWHVTIVKKD